MTMVQILIDVFYIEWGFPNLPQCEIRSSGVGSTVPFSFYQTNHPLTHSRREYYKKYSRVRWD